jgi:hypothetical protein
MRHGSTPGARVAIRRAAMPPSVDLIAVDLPHWARYSHCCLDTEGAPCTPEAPVNQKPDILVAVRSRVTAKRRKKAHLLERRTLTPMPEEAAASRARFRRVVVGALTAIASVACSRSALTPDASQSGAAGDSSDPAGNGGETGASGGGIGAAGASGSGIGGAGATTTGPSDRFGAAWARSASVQTSGEFNSVAADRSGNVYVVGDMWGPGALDFGSGVTPTTASKGWDALLVKYDQSGAAQWAQMATAASSTSTFSSAVVDAAGNVYVSGCIDDSQNPDETPDSVDFGNGVSVAKSDASANALLVKYASSGLAQWAQVVTGSPGSCFAVAALDTEGNVYVVGGVAGTGTYEFGNGITITGNATTSSQVQAAETGVLAKYDSSGAIQWARSVEAGSPASDFTSVATDGEGNVFVAGYVAGTGTYDFGNGVTVAGTGLGTPIAGQEASNALLVKYSSSGIAQWARTPTGSASGSTFSSVAVDSVGDVYAAGSIGGGTYDFGNAVTSTGSVKNGSFTGLAGPSYLAMAKYDASGTAQWARTVNPGGSNSYLTSVAVDSVGSVYVAGAVDATGTYEFGPGVTIGTSSQGGSDYFAALVKYDSSGVAQRAQSCTNGDSAGNIFNSITLDSTGNLYAAGVISGPGVVGFGNSVTLSSTTETPNPGWSPLLVKYH